MTTPPTSVREGVVRGLKIVAGTFATSVPVYFLAQLLFTRELAMALGLASALGASSACRLGRDQRTPSGGVGACSSGSSWPRASLRCYGFCTAHRFARQLPGGHGTFVHWSCAGERVARSLRAIR